VKRSKRPLWWLHGKDLSSIPIALNHIALPRCRSARIKRKALRALVRHADDLMEWALRDAKVGPPPPPLPAPSPSVELAPAIISPLAGVERYSPAHTSHVHRYEHAPAGAGGGFGVAAMVLGVVGLPLSFFFCVYGGLPGVICAVLAIVFGVIGMTGQSGRGLAVAGLVLGVVTAALRLLLHLEFLEIADALSRHR